MVVDGPAVSGSGAAARPRRLRRDDRGLRTRSSAVRRWWPSSPACAIDNDELGGAAAHARYSGAASLVVADLEAAIDVGRRNCWPTCRDTTTRSRRAGRPTTRPTVRRPRPGELMPPTSTGSYDVRDVDPGDRRRRRAARAARPVGAERGHRVRHDRRAAGRHRRQPAARPRRHARHPGVAEGAPASWRSATRSTCRSSRSSTRPASTRARTSSGGA